MNTESWLLLNRVVRFGDTDAAGVMHFHHLFRWCHEAWEESLQNYGLVAEDIFPSYSNTDKKPEVALPIIHCQADFRSPIQTGDDLVVELRPEPLNPNSFQVHFEFRCGEQIAAHAIIRHLAINAQTRQRCALPEGIGRWLEASNLGRVVGSI